MVPGTQWIPSDAWTAWAPIDSVWSPWVKPVLFAHELLVPKNLAGDVAPTSFRVDQLPTSASDAFFVVDRPGAESVAIGLMLAQRGFRPVPLFNGVDGEPALVPVAGIVRALVNGAPKLGELRLASNAPPAFLLDSNRLGASPAPNMFDNRWVVVPEDFPSANRLLSFGRRRCVLIATKHVSDLPHVLLRYRRAGLGLWEAREDGGLTPHAPRRPSSLGMVFARALILAGLRRSSAGGFGGFVPTPSQGGYG